VVEVLARITGGDHHLKGGTELFVGESLVLLWLTRRSSTGAARLLGSTARSPAGTGCPGRRLGQMLVMVRMRMSMRMQRILVLIATLFGLLLLLLLHAAALLLLLLLPALMLLLGDVAAAAAAPDT